MAQTARIEAVRRSALWSAAGDALGFMSELTSQAGLKARTGQGHVDRMHVWRKALNHRPPYVEAELPAGAYSDDTQLRLAVGRSIQSAGRFDVDAFSKIELPVWLSYSLGAGKATKAAASNLAKRDVSWWSNFFDVRGSKYVAAGGNGAAMRIQPHVWAAPRSLSVRDVLKDVVRDAIVTHGHLVGILGAMFHALAVREAVESRMVPHPTSWLGYVNAFSTLEGIIEADPQLGSVWLGLWEKSSERSFAKELARVKEQCIRMVEKALDYSHRASPDYVSFLQEIGGLDPQTRGSGIVSALAASFVSWSQRAKGASGTLVVVANALGSDTDSIASMAGAIAGCAEGQSLEWSLQDRPYIEEQATRLAKIAEGERVDSFSYPVLGLFTPPSSQSDVVGLHAGQLALVGLGKAEPRGQVYEADKAEWQWLELWFGQSILAKRRAGTLQPLSSERLPREPKSTLVPPEMVVESQLGPETQKAFQFRQGSEAARDGRRSGISAERSNVSERPKRTLDELTDQAIRSDFDDFTLGRLLNECVDSHEGIESAIAFVAIVAKAKLARRRKLSR